MEIIEFKTDPGRSQSLIYWRWALYLAGWVLLSVFIELFIQTMRRIDGQMYLTGADASVLLLLVLGFWVWGLMVKAWRYFHYVEPVYRLNQNSIDKVHGWRAKKVDSIPLGRIRMVKIKVTPGGFWLGRKYRDMKIDSTGTSDADLKIPGVLDWENIKLEIERRMK